MEADKFEFLLSYSTSIKDFGNLRGYIKALYEYYDMAIAEQEQKNVIESFKQYIEKDKPINYTGYEHLTIIQAKKELARKAMKESENWICNEELKKKRDTPYTQEELDTIREHIKKQKMAERTVF